MLKLNRKKVAALFMILGILPQSVSFAAEKLDQYNLDEIVVTASQEKIKQELNTPATTEIFTAEDIKNYNGSNVQEVLEYAAGAIAAQPTGVGSTFGMRGLTGASRNPTILVDGVPLNMQGFGNLDAIPVNAVERIEIIRGTGAVLYGTDTFSDHWQETVGCLQRVLETAEEFTAFEEHCRGLDLPDSVLDLSLIHI